MNARRARQILHGYRPSGGDDDQREVRSALKVASMTPALEAEFRNQLAFDGTLAERLDFELPDELAEKLEDAARRLEARSPRRFSFRDPAMLTVGFSFLVLIGLLVWMFIGNMGSFAGVQEAVEMVRRGDTARASQFQEIETRAGLLEDWFVMQDFDGFVVPPGMESAPVVGVRTFKYDNVPVAVAAVADPRALCYVFEAASLGISLEKGEWRIVEFDSKNKRALAITQIGNMAFVIALREGGKAEIQKYIGGLRAGQ